MKIHLTSRLELSGPVPGVWVHGDWPAPRHQEGEHTQGDPQTVHHVPALQGIQVHHVPAIQGIQVHHEPALQGIEVYYVQYQLFKV